MVGKGLLKASCIGYLATILFYILTASISLVELLNLAVDTDSHIYIMNVIVNGIDVAFFIGFAVIACLIAINGLRNKEGSSKASVVLLVLTIMYPLIVVLNFKYGEGAVSFLSLLTFLASAAFIVLYLIGTNMLSNYNKKEETK